MPKPFLHPDDARLESDGIETMLAGLKLWRPDLSYPESHSDMQACFRALLTVYEIRRRPLPAGLRILCVACEGLGKFRHLVPAAGGFSEYTANETCADCGGKGWKRSDP